jgi:LmbE family N-acetylglucosaminyl deacetylase
MRVKGSLKLSALIASGLALSAALPLRAEEVVMDAGRLAHALDRLSNTARVLYVAAHPDDENTRLLAYLANARHVGAAYLSVTRGGGGQNLIGREQDALLDALRTQELLAARRLDGAQQRFTRMRDFGFSKSAEETLSIWGHDAALADVVFALRNFQPDVVITRFDERPPNHGHHTASAILAREAFAAAADPKRFPEQLGAGARVWQAKRVLHNLPNWRDAPPPPPDALALDVGGYDVRLGLSYGELAARSRSQHKSQGFGAAAERGPLIERFVWVAGAPAGADLLEGVVQDWSRFGAPGQAVDAALREARQKLHRDHPERALPALLQARRALAALPQDDVRVIGALAESAGVIARASGLYLRARAAQPSCVPGGTLPLKLEAVLRRPAQVRLSRVLLPGGQLEELEQALPLHEKRELPLVLRCASDVPISRPYWLFEPPLHGQHQLAATAELADAEGPAPLTAAVGLNVGGEALSVPVPLVYVWTDRVYGERERRVLVVPPASVTPARDAVLFPNRHKNRISLRVRAGSDAVSGKALLELPDGWRSEPAEQAVNLARAGDEVVLDFQVTPPRNGTEAGPHAGLAPAARATFEAPAGAGPSRAPATQDGAAASASAAAGMVALAAPQPSAAGRRGPAAGELYARPVIEVGGRRWSFRQDVVDYPHVPMQVVLQPARVRLQPLQLSAPRGPIGYVEGPGDSVAADLAHIGAQIELLSDEALAQGELGRYAAIVLGVRAHNTRDALRTAHPRLMRYVERGGTLIVQYVTRSGMSPLELPLGPFPFEVGRGRVTDENAVMKPVEPAASVLRTPHKLQPEDFTGWVQERGLYFAESWDPRYKPVFELADPGEAPQRGALLIAQHGKGRYVYTGLAFFRQLPAGVPGAYRLLLNLLAARPAESQP